MYTPLDHLQRTRGREGGPRSIPGLAEEMPTISDGRQDLRVHAPQGHQVLGRHARQGERLRAHHQARAEPGVGRLGLLPRHRGRRRSSRTPASADGDIKGIVTDDETGKITINLIEPDARSFSRSPEPFAGLVPAARPCESLPRTRRPASAPTCSRVVYRTDKFVMEKNPNFDLPGIPQGQRRQDHDVRSSRVSAAHDPGRDQRRARLHARTRRRRPAARGRGEVPGPLSRSPPRPIHVLLLHEPHDAAVRRSRRSRQAVNYARRQATRSRGSSAARLTPGCTFLPPGLDRATRSSTRVPVRRPERPPDLEKARAAVKEAGPRAQKVTVWTATTTTRAGKITEYYARHAEQDRASTRT